MNGPIRRELTIRNRLGLHARAASQLVRLAVRFQAEITLEKEGVKVNGKSIMGILMLAAPIGTRVTVEAVGDDAEQAVAEIVRLVEVDRFFEP